MFRFRFIGYALAQLFARPTDRPVGAVEMRVQRPSSASKARDPYSSCGKAVNYIVINKQTILHFSPNKGRTLHIMIAP